MGINLNLPDEKGHFGEFGGRYVSETLIPALTELQNAYDEAKKDPNFQKEIDYYLKNATLIRKEIEALGFDCIGGENAPYVWLKTPAGTDSWGFFDQLLSSAHVVGTPGSGFGASGEGYFRLSAFNSRDNVNEALRRVRESL